MFHVVYWGQPDARLYKTFENAVEAMYFADALRLNGTEASYAAQTHAEISLTGAQSLDHLLSLGDL